MAGWVGTEMGGWMDGGDYLLHELNELNHFHFPCIMLLNIYYLLGSCHISYKYKLFVFDIPANNHLLQVLHFHPTSFATDYAKNIILLDTQL